MFEQFRFIVQQMKPGDIEWKRGYKEMPSVRLREKHVVRGGWKDAG